MLRSADVAAWLRTRGITDPFVQDFPAMASEDLPEMPDRICSVVLFGGGPTLRERTYDQAQVQILTRGEQANPADAETFAAQVDDALMGAVPPLLMSGRRVVSIDRLAGPPQRLEVDDGRRTVMVTNYILQTARDVF